MRIEPRSWKETMQYCPQCGSNLVDKNTDGRNRRACKRCGYIHWNNPIPVVAAIVEQGDQILLARKKGWPLNKWVLIAGFPEAGETMKEAIHREVSEESGLKGEVLDLIGVYSLPWANQVFIVYRVKVPIGKITVCSELEDIKPFHPNQISQVISEVNPRDGAARALRDYLSRAINGTPSSQLSQWRPLQRIV